MLYQNDNTFANHFQFCNLCLMFMLEIKRAKYPAFYVAPKKNAAGASHLALLAQPLLFQGTNGAMLCD